MDPGIEKETRRMAFEAHLAHYEALRSEIVASTSRQNNLVNYSVAVFGGSIVVLTVESSTGILLLSRYPFVLLALSLIMSLITWASLEAEVHIHDRMRFIDDVLRGKVQKLIQGDENVAHYQVFRMENVEISRGTPRTGFRLLLVTGKFLIAFLPAVGFFVAFRVLTEGQPPTPGYVAWLFWGVLAAGVVVIVGFLTQVIFVGRHYYFGKKRAAAGSLQ